jgi:hypothetical protein
MEEDELIAFVRANGYPRFTARQLKRFREQKVVEVQIERPGFGGTTSTYAQEAAERTLAVCQLLKQTRNFHAVRFWLWLEGHPVEVGLLKESIWNLTPFSTWKAPETGRERHRAAQVLAQKPSMRHGGLCGPISGARSCKILRTEKINSGFSTKQHNCCTEYQLTSHETFSAKAHHRSSWRNLPIFSRTGCKPDIYGRSLNIF